MNEAKVIEEEWKTVDDGKRKAGCGVIVAEKKVLHVERGGGEEKPEPSARAPAPGCTTPCAEAREKERKAEIAALLQEKLSVVLKYSPSPVRDPKGYSMWASGLVRHLDALGRVDPEYKQTVEIEGKIENTVPLTAQEMTVAAGLMAAVKEREGGDSDQ